MRFAVVSLSGLAGLASRRQGGRGHTAKQWAAGGAPASCEATVGPDLGLGESKWWEAVVVMDRVLGIPCDARGSQ